jgi:hypothetical protein
MRPYLRGTIVLPVTTSKVNCQEFVGYSSRLGSRSAK